MDGVSRRGFLATAGLTLLGGCNSLVSSNSGSETNGTALVPTADERLPLPREPQQLRQAARSGGPPKDGIPSIDDPKFVRAEGVDFLEAGDPVFGVVRDGDVRAYPQKILVQHEIVNDTLAGTPVSVTYCPLTGTAQGFHRGETTFGVSGRLINANLVMYDRSAETWWPQILATSIPGEWNESPEIRSLQEFRLIWTTWERWQTHHPDTRVLSTETGHARNYNRDAYGGYNPARGYYTDDDLLFPALSSDDRYHPKTVVMGARTPDGAVAFVKDALRETHLLTGQIGETPLLAVYDPRYDTGYVYRNPAQSTFERDGNHVTAPDGTSYRRDELPLTRIHTFDAMWFAWAGYYPETNVYE